MASAPPARALTAAPVQVGVTWIPADVGLHLWQEPSANRALRDLTAIRAAGISNVRIHLSWDAFMPTDGSVSRHRLADLDAVLRAAATLGLSVVPVLFGQRVAGCVQLPAYLVDPRRRRAGVRVLTDGVPQSGGPRDLWCDPLVVEVADRWLRALLGAFANHPAVVAWDLGHDPAGACRPRRISDIPSWLATLVPLIRAQGDRVQLTLSAADVLVARAVRPALIAGHVDVLGLSVDPGWVAHRLGVPGREPQAAELMLRLFQQLAGPTSPPVTVVTGLGVDDGAPSASEVDPPARPRGESLVPEGEAPRQTAELLGRLRDAGAGGLFADLWAQPSARAMDAPPLDRRPTFALHALASAAGEPTAWCEPWRALAAAEPARAAPQPWPPALESEDWYGALPDGALDVLQQWQRDIEPAGGHL